MPSLPVRIVSFILGTTGIVRSRFSGGERFLATIRAAQALPRSVPSAKMAQQFAVDSAAFGGSPVWTMAPKDGPVAAHILFWHGGGYVYPISPLHWKFLAHMVEEYRWSVTVPYYPLAPESDAQRTTGWALDFYRQHAAAHGNNFIMAGDSAGGGLTAAIAMLARNAALPLPSKLLLICPWLALDPSDSEQAAIEPREVILTRSGIAEAGQLYAGDLPVIDPRCSPIFGSWDGLPPIMAFGGGNDILVTDARALKAKLPEIEYAELPGMMHDWPIFFFSESRAAQKQMADFAGQAVT
jgi:epsilon-lactone hydrolase